MIASFLAKTGPPKSKARTLPLHISNFPVSSLTRSKHCIHITSRFIFQSKHLLFHHHTKEWTHFDLQNTQHNDKIFSTPDHKPDDTTYSETITRQTLRWCQIMDIYHWLKSVMDFNLMQSSHATFSFKTANFSLVADAFWSQIRTAWCIYIHDSLLRPPAIILVFFFYKEYFIIVIFISLGNYIT
jgi:hypothetical protein